MRVYFTRCSVLNGFGPIYGRYQKPTAQHKCFIENRANTYYCYYNAVVTPGNVIVVYKERLDNNIYFTAQIVLK